ncbi:MAG: hypothetical protein WCS88_01150 [Patescibacteria group bacterium]|jgi:hypothetical protein
MKLVKNKIIIFSLFIALANLFVLGCFFTSSDFNNTHDNTMPAMECCNMGAYSFSEHVGYDLQYMLSEVGINLWGINFILAVIIFLYIKFDILSNYFLLRDRYGGFKLFYKFTFLFSNGILHPKIY